MMHPKPSPPVRRKPKRYDAAERSHVKARDGGCVLRFMDVTHVCRDQFGRPHASTPVLDCMTIEHVKRDLRAGVRAEEDRRRMVVMCFGANVGVPSKDVREWLRAHLARVEPDS